MLMSTGRIVQRWTRAALETACSLARSIPFWTADRTWDKKRKKLQSLLHWFSFQQVIQWFSIQQVIPMISFLTINKNGKMTVSVRNFTVHKNQSLLVFFIWISATHIRKACISKANKEPFALHMSKLWMAVTA